MSSTAFLHLLEQALDDVRRADRLPVGTRKRKIKLPFQSYAIPLTGDEVVIFLEHLLHCIPGPIVMVWDKHPIHGRRKVKDFLACHPRLQVYDYFPTAAPELTPTEFVWTQVTWLQNLLVSTSLGGCRR